MNTDKTLQELCSSLQISRRAIQGYEQYGLVKATGRTKMGHLLYDAAAQEQIRRIRKYQQYGFRLRELQELFSATPTALKERLQLQLVLLLENRDRLDATIHLITEEIRQL